MSLDITSPQRAAIQLYKIIEAFSRGLNVSPFPVDVEQIALGVAEQFKWRDPITQIIPADIPGFEGALVPNDRGDKWALLYNESIASPGRIRFTMAHELGHYCLHRLQRQVFQCSEKDMTDWSNADKNIEAQADVFASYLLMPLADFRAQVTAPVDFEFLGRCADRYGVSLTAAVLKWLSFTDEKAVLIQHNDGFIDWSISSEAARSAGAFFKHNADPIEIPSGSLAAEGSIRHERIGVAIAVRDWWPNSEEDSALREMKISSDQYGNVLTLLVLQKHSKVWPKWQPS